MKAAALLEWVKGEFEKAGIPWVLIGGLALHAYGVSRYTADADVLIAETDLPAIRKILSKKGFNELARTSIFARFIHKAECFDLDFLFVEMKTIQRILREGREIHFGKIRVRVPSLEHLIAMKLHAVKNDPKREMKDLFDVYELVKLNRKVLTRKKIDDLVQNYGNPEIADKINKMCSEWL